MLQVLVDDLYSSSCGKIPPPIECAAVDVANINAMATRIAYSPTDLFNLPVRQATISGYQSVAVSKGVDLLKKYNVLPQNITWSNISKCKVDERTISRDDLSMLGYAPDSLLHSVLLMDIIPHTLQNIIPVSFDAVANPAIMFVVLLVVVISTILVAIISVNQYKMFASNHSKLI